MQTNTYHGLTAAHAAWTHEAERRKVAAIAKDGKTWTTAELQRDYEVVGFAAGICVVRRKSDGVRGSLDFTHMPRFYFDFVVDDVRKGY